MDKSELVSDAWGDIKWIVENLRDVLKEDDDFIVGLLKALAQEFEHPWQPPSPS